MPAQSNHVTLARQWELLQRIPAKPPGKTVLELTQELDAEGFGVTKRTVQRDLDDLSLLFPLQCNDKGIPHGWYWQEGSAVELPAISIEEAQSLLLVKDLLRPLVPQALLKSLDRRFETAVRKLNALAKDNLLARWPEKVRAVPAALPLLSPQIDSDVLATLQQALLREQQCDVTYQGFAADAASPQTLHPLALLQRGPVTYLVATAFEYSDPRLYAVHRIRSATILDAARRQPKGFQLDEYIAAGAPQFGSGNFIALEARVSDVLGHILRETPLSADMQVHERESDWWQLSATVQDTWQLRWWIKSQGEDIVVRKPQALRRDLLNELKQTLDNYRDRSLNR